MSLDAPEIQAAIAGDSAALDRVWGAHRRWVAAVVLAQRPDSRELDDLLQDVAVAVVRRIGELRDPMAFRAWLRSVAINVVRSHGRRLSVRRRVGLALDEEQPDPNGVGVGHGAECRDDVTAAMKLVARLPSELREVLLLKVQRGLTQREIAAMLEVPETTVETRLARARRQLRRTAVENDSFAGARSNGPSQRVIR